MKAAVEDLDQRVATVSVFRDKWLQIFEAWSRCRKQIEPTQKRIGVAIEKWRHFDSEVSRKEEDVKGLTSQLEQAVINLKNGVKDVSYPQRHIALRLIFVVSMDSR